MNCNLVSWSTFSNSIANTVSTMQKNLTMGSTALLCAEVFSLVHVGRSFAEMLISSKEGTDPQVELKKMLHGFGRFFISSSVVVGVAPYINAYVFGPENTKFHMACSAGIVGMSFLKNAYQISR